VKFKPWAIRLTGQAICFTASEGLAYKCPLEAPLELLPTFQLKGLSKEEIRVVRSEWYDNKGGSQTCTLTRGSGKRSLHRFAIGERPLAVRLHGE